MLRLVVVLPVVVALVTLAVFAPALLNGFVWDDEANFLGNPHYRGLGWPELRWIATTRLMGHWIPLTWLTLSLDYVVWGMNPAGYHLTNLLLHAANAVVLYFVALRLLRLALTTAAETPLRLGATAAALFFAVHPLRAESVAWLTERRDVLSGLFFLLTVLTYLKAQGADATGRPRWLITSVGCYALALMSKSIVMSLPFVLLVLDVYPLGRLPGRWREWLAPQARGAWKEKLPYALLALAGAGIAYVTVYGKTPLERYPVPARIAMTLYSLGFYVWATVFPLGLSPLHELPRTVALLDLPFLVSAMAVAFITAATWRLRRRWPAGLALWIAYGAMLAPVSGLFHAGPQLVAERYSYLSCLGWALLVGAGVPVTLGARQSGSLRPAFARAPVAMVALWIVGLAGTTWVQVQTWRDPDTLWRAALEVDPLCSGCHGNLAVSLETRGFTAAAIEHFERALALRPDDTGYHRRNLGLTLYKTGRLPQAIAQFRLGLEQNPTDVEVRNYLGVALIQQGNFDEAARELRQVIRLDPNRAGAMTNLGTALAALGRPAEAVPYFERAIAVNPRDPISRFGLTRAYLALGNCAAARRQAEVLRGLDPRLLAPALAARRGGDGEGCGAP